MFVLPDEIDPNRNLAAAFSDGKKDFPLRKNLLQGNHICLHYVMIHQLVDFVHIIKKILQMYRKKTIFLLTLAFLVTSCADSWDSVKRGLTGEKRVSTDEFFIKKKDPLILPPDYENLPSPEERVAVMDEISAFEKTLGTSIEDSSSASSSIEESILKKIQSK